MDSHVTDVVREMTRASDEERILFPQVVARLMEAGVERYHADLVAGTKTYYLPNGQFEEVRCHRPSAPASDFDGAAVEAAVRASQRQEIQYRDFCERVAAGGCVGYFVSLVGRRATYYGRTSETHVEYFPDAEPPRSHDADPSRS
jgi:uncharacterized protein YbcV (DUF1398 family)